MWKVNQLILVVILYLIPMPPLLGLGTVEQVLSQVPELDRCNIEKLFRQLLVHSPAGYTLHGDKPISMISTFNIEECSTQSAIISAQLSKGWASWEKFKELFGNTYFEMKFEKKLWRNGLITKSLYLINKNACIETIRANLKLFQTHFRKEPSAEGILQFLCKTPDALTNLPENLKGLLLGFGLENAQEYSRWNTLIRYFITTNSPPFSQRKLPIEKEYIQHITNSYPEPYNNSKISFELFGELAAEFNAICKRRESFELSKRDNIKDLFYSPHFINFSPNPELIKKYSNIREELEKTYLKSSFIKTTLEQWMDPQ